jgi:large subunit ribosomal protein L15
MPLIRRIPKRGFNNARFAQRYIPVNLESLNNFENGTKVDEALLRAKGLANGPKLPIKILGGGQLTKNLFVTAHRFSAGARVKIEGLGGSCEIIMPKAQKAEAAKAK